MSTSDVLQIYLQEKYQCQGKYNGHKHQRPSGKYESSLSHNTCALVAGGFREKKRTGDLQNRLFKSAATIHICSRFAERVLIGVIQGHLLKRYLGLFRLEVNGQVTIHK
jgi:hypothetical protein